MCLPDSLAMRRIIIRSILVLITLIVGFAVWAFWPESAAADLDDIPTSYDYDVTIRRDRWGVPHVYGTTDADVAYGLAWAHAEDDFLTIQQSILAARGDLAVHYGVDAAPNDFLVATVRMWDSIDARYETDLSPELRAILDSYADGLNHYAATHADEAFRGLFPVDGKDILAPSVHKSPLFFGLDGTLGELLGPEPPADDAVPIETTAFGDIRFGSNFLAVAPHRSEDGSTHFASNSHQPWDGPVAWYEARVHSEEGWDMTGALFPSMPVLALGHTPNLAWTFTVNHGDFVDLYRLDIDPADEDRYRVDGEWLDLEVTDVPIEVKIFGRFRWTVTEQAYWSIFGPVLKTSHGTYAVRYAGMDTIGIYEQLYRMSKAADFEEWHEAMARRDGLPSFNVGYADSEGTIYYVYNGLIPDRDPGYDWSLILPGDTTATLWTEYLAFDELPQVRDPDAGFLQNSNSAPFSAAGPGSLDPSSFPAPAGFEEWETNRSLRSLELFGNDEAISRTEFVSYKFDRTFAEESDAVDMIGRLLDLDPATFNNAYGLERIDVDDALDALAAWDREADPIDRATALVVHTLVNINDASRDQWPDLEINPSRLTVSNVPGDLLEQAFAEAIATLVQNYGTPTPPWGEVNRLRRGDVDVALGGGPDLLHAVYGAEEVDGSLSGIAGDAYVLVVTWTADGELISESIHQYGAATIRDDSPHYSDQALLFANRELKDTFFDEAELLENLESEYRPGE